jgi:hypothetical protein
VGVGSATSSFTAGLAPALFGATSLAFGRVLARLVLVPHHQFKESRWNRINKHERQNYLKNAYRVLLTCARQGMVLVVPEGSNTDPTRAPGFYDPTYRYFWSLGLPELT